MGVGCGDGSHPLPNPLLRFKCALALEGEGTKEATQYTYRVMPLFRYPAEIDCIESCSGDGDVASFGHTSNSSGDLVIAGR